MGRYRPTAPLGSRSALTATNNSLTPTSIPAASGCKMGNSSHPFFDLFAIGSSSTGRVPMVRIRANSQSRSSSQLTSVIRLVPIIISLYPVPLHAVWQTPVARFLVSIPLFRPHLATKHAIHKNEVAESEAHPQRPPNKPHS